MLCTPVSWGGEEIRLRRNASIALSVQVILLGLLAAAVGLNPVGWGVALACGVTTYVVIARVLHSSGGVVELGPADLITLTRATMACCVAGLVAHSFLQQPVTTPLVALATTALLLDAVDGWVARRTRSTSEFGARFDGETDAFLILVLSVYVAGSLGAWVLAIGAARYVFAVAGWCLPWMRRLLPRRHWRKVVCAIQGIVLVVAAADVLPRSWAVAAVAVALGILAESFARDTWWLWRRRHIAGRVGVGAFAGLPETSPEPVGPDVPVPSAQPGRRTHPVAASTADVLALLLVWFALVAPNQLHLMTPEAFLRIPAEGLAVVGLALLLPPRAGRVLAVGVGVLLAALTLLKILDLGFFAAFDRPFNLITDRGYFGSTVGLVSQTFGSAGAAVAVAAAAALAVALLVLMPLSVGRLTRIVARHPRRSWRALAAVSAVWVVSAVVSVPLGPQESLASTSAGGLAVDKVRAVADGVHDQQRFEAAASIDRFRAEPERELLTGLRGKDVIIAFVESYGRTALEGSADTQQVRTMLDAATGRLAAAGYASRSAYLTSPTFGGLSWLAHATLQSGLWVDNEPRYDRLITANRMTLSKAFRRAGWRTVAVLPQNNEPWPEGRRFYRFQQLYDRPDFGYAGPKFGWSAIPDQYVLSTFQRLELARKDRAPVMAQLDLASSHAPWAPVPRMVGWRSLGDGSGYWPMHSAAAKKADLWSNPSNVRTGYFDAITYSLTALIEFVERYGDDDLVLIILGDHQPATVVSGHGASHDVPVSVVARDERVLDQISAWDWQDGMRPDAQAPVWPMHAFRDRFLDAYSQTPGSTASDEPSDTVQVDGPAPRADTAGGRTR